MSSIAERLATIRERIPPSVTLIAVSKRQSVQAIREAYAAGQRAFGENYAQELATKRDELADLADIEWHFVGALQSNKAKLIVPGAALVHAVDSMKAAEALSRRAVAAQTNVSALIEVNVGGEGSKSGVTPEEARPLLLALANLPSLNVRGLMCIPPRGSAEESRPYFRKLRLLRDSLVAEFPTLVWLSMGMSGDYRIALEEGSTHIRLGTAIFGERPAK